MSVKLSYPRKSILIFSVMKKELFSDLNAEFQYFENLEKLFSESRQRQVVLFTYPKQAIASGKKNS